MKLQDESFEKLRIFLQDSNLESIRQGLTLIESLDVSESDFMQLISMIGNTEIELTPNQRILEERFKFLHHYDARKLALWTLHTWIRVAPHRSVDIDSLSTFRIKHYDVPEDFSHLEHLREVNICHGEWTGFPTGFWIWLIWSVSTYRTIHGFYTWLGTHEAPEESEHIRNEAAQNYKVGRGFIRTNSTVRHEQ